MLVILEGQARTGKTSLSKNLARSMRQMRGWDVVLAKSYKRDRYMEYMVRQVVPMAIEPRFTILDRAHISEIVYRTVDQSIDAESLADMLAVDRVLAAAGTIQILLVAEPEELIGRHEASGRCLEGDVETIGDLFGIVIQQTAIKTLIVNTTHMTHEAVVDEVMDFLRDHVENFYMGGLE